MPMKAPQASKVRVAVCTAPARVWHHSNPGTLRVRRMTERRVSKDVTAMIKNKARPGQPCSPNISK